MMKLMNVLKLHANMSNLQEGHVPLPDAPDPLVDSSPVMAFVTFEIVTTLLVFFAWTPRVTRALRGLWMPKTAITHQLASLLFLADVGHHACDLISPGDSLESMLWWFGPIGFAFSQVLAPVLVYIAVQFRDWKALGIIIFLAVTLFATAFPLAPLLDMKTRLGTPLFHSIHMMGHVIFSVLYARMTETLQYALYGQAKK